MSPAKRPLIDVVVPDFVQGNIKVAKWKVKERTTVYDGRLLLLYEADTDESPSVLKKLKSSEVGVVKELLVKEGETLSPGSLLLRLEKGCNHPTVINDLCAECGADLQAEPQTEEREATVSMVHSVPQLKVSKEEAHIIAKADEAHLLQHRKLVLLVDLDQTLIHTTNDNIPNNYKDVYHFQLYGEKSPWYHTRLRPGTHEFLAHVSEQFELHICTFGSRNYAYMIAHFLDPQGKYFSHRILSRDEFFSPISKTANLKELFPCGDNLVCIIDDREDVWEYVPNLIHVKPYHFFQHSGDINAPPEAAKSDDGTQINSEFAYLVQGITLKNKPKTDGQNPLLIVNSKLPDAELNQNESVSSTNESSDQSVDESQFNSDENNIECNTLAENSVNDVVELGPSECEMNHKIKGTDVSNHSDKPETNGELAVISLDFAKLKTFNETGKDLVQIVADSNQPDLETYTCGDDDQRGPMPIAFQPNGESGNLIPEGVDGMGEQVEPYNSAPPVEDLIEFEEEDDYLLYLEEILSKVHKVFYDQYDSTGTVPDLKVIVPETRRKVLEDVKIVFSGVVQKYTRLENSRAYNVALQLGAEVCKELNETTTHVVAMRRNTTKVHAAQKMKHVKVVTPEWLWMCAERWEKVDERLFPIKNVKVSSRVPPLHCSSPEHTPPDSPGTPKPQEERFMDTINPLMSFSSEDIAKMAGEVDDIFNEPETEPENEPSTSLLAVQRRLTEQESSSGSSDEEMKEYKRRYDAGVKKKAKKRHRKSSNDDETLASKFQRGEPLRNDMEPGSNVESDVENENDSDNEWMKMGAALEREFFLGEEED